MIKLVLNINSQMSGKLRDDWLKSACFNLFIIEYNAWQRKLSSKDSGLFQKLSLAYLWEDFCPMSILSSFSTYKS